MDNQFHKLDIVEEDIDSRFEKIPFDERQRALNLPYSLPKHLRNILDGFKWAIHYKNQSAVMIVDGRSGLGKTTLSSQIGLYMDKSFDLSKVFFTPQDFLVGLSKAKKGDCLIFDEAMVVSSRSALTQMNRMIVIAMSMIRSKNLLIIFNVNSIFDLDKNLALSRADILLSLYGDSLTDKGNFMAFFKGSDGKDRIKELYLKGKKTYSYSYPKSNFNSSFSSHLAFDDIEYEKKKQENINRFLTGNEKMSKKEMKNYKRFCKALIFFRKKLNFPYPYIAKIFDEDADNLRKVIDILKDPEKYKEIMMTNSIDSQYPKCSPFPKSDDGLPDDFPKEDDGFEDIQGI